MVPLARIGGGKCAHDNNAPNSSNDDTLIIRNEASSAWECLLVQKTLRGSPLAQTGLDPCGTNASPPSIDERELNQETTVSQGAKRRDGSRLFGRRPLALVMGATVIALLFGLQCSRSVEAAPVPVRFSEGSVHGFLVLRSADDSVLAYGDLQQTARGSTVQSGMTFRFLDGSTLEERVTFTQSETFAMQSYRFEIKGKTFPHDQTISLERSSGKYRVETTPRGGGKAEVEEGVLDLPADVYNGMVITIAKNLTRSQSTRVHFVAFLPKPRLIEIELVNSASEKVRVGPFPRNAAHFVVKPQLGALIGLFARLTGKLPPDNHVWIMTGQVPAFVRADGPLFMDGPSWRVELASPTFAH